MILPSGFALPPLPYLVTVLAAAGSVAWGIRRASPPVTARTVLAWAPWMAVGSALYVCHQLGLVPPAVAPLAGSPTVYLTTFAVAGATWLAAMRTPAPRRVLAGVGFLALSAPVAVALRYGTTNGTLTLAWPLAGAALAGIASAALWAGLRRARPEDARVADGAGALVVFGHALDAFTTAVGVDVLGYGEQTPLSRLIIEFGRSLPTAPALGGGWLFVLVKLALAVAVVLLVVDYVREEPAEGYLLLGLVAAVGLGPGAHNLLLFVVASPAGF